MKFRAYLQLLLLYLLRYCFVSPSLDRMWNYKFINSYFYCLPLWRESKFLNCFHMTNLISLHQPKPRIDYTLKAKGGSLTAIPGLSDMIDVSFVYGVLSSGLNEFVSLSVGAICFV